jgi:hypothetical protein
MILTCKVRLSSLHNRRDHAILTGHAMSDLSGAIQLNVNASSSDAPYRSAYAATLIVCVRVYPPDKLPVTVLISRPAESSLKILSDALYV